MKPADWTAPVGMVPCEVGPVEIRNSQRVRSVGAIAVQTVNGAVWYPVYRPCDAAGNFLPTPAQAPTETTE